MRAVAQQAQDLRGDELDLGARAAGRQEPDRVAGVGRGGRVGERRSWLGYA